MSDEFPTLEAALAASVVVLLWRGWLLRRSRIGFQAATQRLLDAFKHGPPSARALVAAHLGAFVEPLARAALIAQPHEAPRAVSERAARLRRRVRSAAARDIVVLAVLGGSLVYALVSQMVVSRTFYALGAIASTLLLAAVVERIRLDRAIAHVADRLRSTLGTPVETSSPKGSLCSNCGGLTLVRLTTSEELGAQLWSLGAREVSLCRRCGEIQGQAKPARPGSPVS